MKTKGDLRLEMLEEKIRHEGEIKDLGRSRDYAIRMKDLEKDGAINDLKKVLVEEKRGLELENRALKSKVECLEARLKDDKSVFLMEIMKALLVKFPTMDIKELSVTGKAK